MLKYESYLERGGRVEVEAKYLRAEVDVVEGVAVQFTGLIDAISGASPTGMLPANPGDPIPTAQLPGEDRVSGVFDVTLKFGKVGGLVEYSYSDEPDYLSRGVATQWTYDLNEKMTTVRAGFSILNDTVMRSPVDTDRRAADFLIGVTQILDANTTLTLNVGYGTNRGYLGDPYKGIGFTEFSPIPGVDPFVDSYFENRPNSRDKWVVYTQGLHYFEPLKASVEGSYRFFTDDWGIDSHTVELTWHQKLGESFVLSPTLRFYRQSAADFYYTTLDGTGITPTSDPTGLEPYYSADHRLSELDAVTLGIKLVWFMTDAFTFDISYEEYRMYGRDGITLAGLYPTADIITIGARYAF